MTTAKQTFDFPPLYINYYLHELLSSYTDINMATSNVSGYIPFFPAGQAVNVDQIYSDLALSESNKLPSVIFYDRMIRLRPDPFYVRKREQALYTIYGDVENCMNIGSVISQVLDREDASAQELNKWINENQEWLSIPKFKEDGTPNFIVFNGKTKYGAELPMKIFFRSMRVFQVDESRDLVELEGYRRGSIHKYIVEYDYHIYVDKDTPKYLQ